MFIGGVASDPYHLTQHVSPSLFCFIMILHMLIPILRILYFWTAGNILSSLSKRTLSTLLLSLLKFRNLWTQSTDPENADQFLKQSRVHNMLLLLKVAQKYEKSRTWKNNQIFMATNETREPLSVPKTIVKVVLLNHILFSTISYGQNGFKWYQS